MALVSPRISRQNVEGQDTQVFLQSFSDRTLVLVTQLGKVGNLIQASIPPTAPLLRPTPLAPGDPQSTLLQPSPAIQLTPLLGSYPSEHLQALHSLYASQIATIIWNEESQSMMETLRRSVVIGIALRPLPIEPGCDLTEKEKNIFRVVMAMLHGLLRL